MACFYRHMMYNIRYISYIYKGDFMKNKSEIGIYTCIWGIAVIILVFSIFQNMVDVKAVNYCGIIRGASQKLIKEELYNVQDDEEIVRLDSFLNFIQTGKGDLNYSNFHDSEYKGELNEVSILWEDMKEEIYNVREGASKSQLFEMSQTFFEKANTMVYAAEAYARKKLFYLIFALVGYLLCSIGLFTWWTRKKQKEIQVIRYQDEITGLSNFFAFKIDMQKLMSMTASNDYILITFDIDNFKFLNTTYGYTFGTEMLKIIANSLSSFIGNNEICARQGSDNFLLFVHYKDEVIEQIKSILYKDINDKATLNIGHDITFTFGVCVYHNGEFKEFEDLLDSANLAHKNAKQKGRGNVVWYNDEFLKKIVHDNMIVGHMRHALETEEFQMYLQPKFEIATGKIIAAEALVRWKTKEDGILFPDEFIPLFEQNGFIFELDLYMLNKACEFIKELHFENSGFTISVNFSRVTLYHKDFYKEVTRIMKHHKIPLTCIEMEITESAFNGLDDFILKMLKKLQKIGFRLSIDDFGTGYSTLNLLNTLPIDVLKIDRDFVKKIGTSKHAVSIIELIIGVSHTLDIQVVCEGIETKKQLSYLKELKCDFGQGYYISRPVEACTFKKEFLSLDKVNG